MTGSTTTVPVGSVRTHQTSRKRLRKHLRSLGLDEAVIAKVIAKRTARQVARREDRAGVGS